MVPELIELKRALDELVVLRDNLTSTQDRCSTLLNENRELKKRLRRMRTDWMALLDPEGNGGSARPPK